MAFKEIPPTPPQPRESRTVPLAPAAKPASAAPPVPPVPPTKPETRLVSLDAYRGFIMLLMASAGLGVARLVRATDLALEGKLEEAAKLSPGGTLLDAGIVAGTFADR